MARPVTPARTCFRRICTLCRRPIDWTDPTEEGVGFFHLADKTPLCEGGHVDLEVGELLEDGTVVPLAC